MYYIKKKKKKSSKSKNLKKFSFKKKGDIGRVCRGSTSYVSSLLGSVSSELFVFEESVSGFIIFQAN
ncbi:hypothetical protein BpHYR1_051295 [Brachionus plicatilis]|uniref:Uncharacterized protein n=1 Tax=Brachionus plicatilis TaxID=10195 RepID=A0A3M7Q8A4_BRAPC|nr:hypothetical protein BpHYR1_051295 [Brachionus plicatilis]